MRHPIEDTYLLKEAGTVRNFRVGGKAELVFQKPSILTVARRVGNIEPRFKASDIEHKRWDGIKWRLRI